MFALWKGTLRYSHRTSVSFVSNVIKLTTFSTPFSFVTETRNLTVRSSVSLIYKYECIGFYSHPLNPLGCYLTEMGPFWVPSRCCMYDILGLEALSRQFRVRYAGRDENAGLCGVVSCNAGGIV